MVTIWNVTNQDPASISACLKDFEPHLTNDGVRAWANTVLSRYLAKNDTLGEIPEAVALCYDAYHDGSFKEVIGAVLDVVAGLNRTPQRLSHMSVPDAIKHLDLQCRQTRNKLAKASALGFIKSHPDIIAAHCATPTWSWTEVADNRYRAKITIGPFGGIVDFLGGHGEFAQGWCLDHRTEYFLKSTRKANFVKEVPTGLFPKFNSAIKEITQDFLRNVRPKMLTVTGADAKRNAWNAEHYAAWCPDGYELLKHKGGDEYRADSNGVTAVIFHNWDECWKTMHDNVPVDLETVHFVDEVALTAKSNPSHVPLGM